MAGHPIIAPMKVLLTGATGMVGEAVLLECLDNPLVEQVCSVTRRSCERSHPKLTEILISDFRDVSAVEASLRGYAPAPVKLRRFQTVRSDTFRQCRDGGRAHLARKDGRTRLARNGAALDVIGSRRRPGGMTRALVRA